MMADRLPHACARERAHVLVHRPPGREDRGWRQVAPLTAGSHEVEQAVQRPPHVGRARPTAGLGGRDQGHEQGVLLVAERLPGAEVADEGPVLRCPHGVPPRRATPFPKPPARPLRLVIRLDRTGFSNGLLVVHPLSEMRLLWVWSVTRGTGPGWGGCDDPSGARIERGGGAQAGADDALTETRRGAGPPCADYPARG